MLRFIIFLAFVANLNFVLTDSTSEIAAVDVDVKNVRPKCKENEELSDCPNKVCREKTCDDLGYPLPCLQSSNNITQCGRPSCICVDGYVRNRKGVCIPKRDCPSCGGDPNARSGCGSYCTNCSNYKGKGNFCILICKVNSCDCRSGYLYDGIKKKCVLPEQCSCGRNEVRSDCANSPCVIENCSQKDLNIRCKPDRTTCKPGCLCAEGYLRNENGVCIPKDQCPPTLECGLNEVPSDCGNNGCLNTCAQPDLLSICKFDTTKCKPGCVCADGYLKDKNGACVPQDQCPPTLQCSQNEVPSDCGNNGCLNTCAQPDLLLRCSYDPSTCKPGCVCADGYLKDNNGVCVPQDQCPPINVCLLPPETGPCRANYRKFYYNSSKKDCIEFVYGGCKGNENRYDTKEECLRKCNNI